MIFQGKVPKEEKLNALQRASLALMLRQIIVQITQRLA